MAKALILMTILLLPFAAASNVAGCRVEYLDGWGGACVVEQTLAALGPLKAGAGLEARPFRGMVSLYLFARLALPGWTLTLEGHQFTALNGVSGTGIGVSVWVSW